VTKFVPAKGDEKLLLNWFEEDLPVEEEEEEEKDADAPKPKLRMAETPLASDGKYLYALSMKLKPGDEDKTWEIDSILCNVFSLDKNAVKKEREFEIKVDLGEDKTYKSGLKHGGFFNDWSLACNGEVLMVHWPKKTTSFRAKEGDDSLGEIIISDTMEESEGT
jgi:hypothetical protein